MKKFLDTMKVLLTVSLVSIWAFGQGPAQRAELNVNEIVSQLGLCNANLVVEQRYVKSLQDEIKDLKKQLSAKSIPSTGAINAVPGIDEKIKTPPIGETK